VPRATAVSLSAFGVQLVHPAALQCLHHPGMDAGVAHCSACCPCLPPITCTGTAAGGMENSWLGGWVAVIGTATGAYGAGGAAGAATAAGATRSCL
jgi:hypothetical protein